MKHKVKELSAEVIAIADTISVIEEQLQEEDITLLKVGSRYLQLGSETKHHNNSLFLPPELQRHPGQVSRGFMKVGLCALVDGSQDGDCVLAEVRVQRSAQTTCVAC